jgi:hypothetical protein
MFTKIKGCRAGIPGPLLRSGLVLVRAGNYVYAAAFAVEDDLAVDQRKQGVIFALADAFACVELGAQLTDDDVAGDYFLAAETLDAAALTVGIATVAAGALTFFVRHGGSTFELNRKRQWHAPAEKTCGKRSFFSPSILSVEPAVGNPIADVVEGGLVEWHAVAEFAFIGH